MIAIPKYDKNHWSTREFYDSFKKAFLEKNPILLDNRYLQTDLDVPKYVTELYSDLENEFYKEENLSLFQTQYLRFKKAYNVHFRWYVYERFVDFLISLNKIEEALKEWTVLQEEEWYGINQQFTYRESAISKLMYFESKLKRGIINGYYIDKIAPKGSQLTAFGRRNKNNILLVINTILSTYSVKSFFELFYRNYSFEGKKYKSKFSIEYYDQFFLHDSKSKKVLDWYKSEEGIKFGGAKSKKGVVSESYVKLAMKHKASELLREAENDYRLSIGAKKVGESWISETELFYKLKKVFENQKVLHHGKPDWLGRQHVDIWFPKHKIGIEYQGLQHDKPIEFFGGHEAYIKNIERDQRKRNLFNENQGTLI